MNTQEAEKWLKDNGFSNACIRIDEYHRPDLYVSDVLIKYAQQQVKNLNIPAVSGSFLDWQKIEDEVADMYKLPVAVNTNGLKFKFYAEFLSGASWMRKRILGNDR